MPGLEDVNGSPTSDFGSWWGGAEPSTGWLDVPREQQDGARTAVRTWYGYPSVKSEIPDRSHELKGR